MERKYQLKEDKGFGIIKSEMYYLRKFHHFDELQLAIDKYIIV